ncbi:MAG: hypothetical protein ABIJ09_06875 [Pseudomonadota bacterium]
MRQFTLAVLTLGLIAATACTPDPLGGKCAEKEDDVYGVMKPKDGDNFVSQDPTAFLNCDTFICLSTNGSLPYCTKRCASDTECLNGNGIAMECKVVTEFGALACRAPDHAFCPSGALEDELCCDREETTGAVKEPAKYCAAKDGEVAHDPKAEPIGG